jgi:hypothetical protein
MVDGDDDDDFLTLMVIIFLTFFKIRFLWSDTLARCIRYSQKSGINKFYLTIAIAIDLLACAALCVIVILVFNLKFNGG